ncbi:hypothetical protein OAT11_00920 [Nitrospinaceae bacterium]|nr:hypothetical protein [Nitrospinaceae bacterium]
MCSIKEDNVQTYPIRKSEKPKQYAFPIVVLVITALLISAVCSLAIPYPLGNSIQQHMKENRKPR